jgi:hypothetical protein
VSRLQISRNDDLHRLREDGYDVDIVNGHLLVRGVPYVTAKREIARGVISARTLRLEGDKTLPPEDHVVRFIGEFPCDKDGNRISNIGGSPETVTIAEGLVATTLLSSKPPGGYKDYYEMMTRYIEIIENEAKALDKSVTSRQYLPWEPEPEESVFRYIDTSASRAGLTAVNAKLEGERIGIVGIGGAGSYVLDLIAKTGVQEIHLFDGDHIETHNVFRAPGAIRLEDLRTRPNKAVYWRDRYDALRRSIIAHDSFVTEENAHELADLTFIFICVDSGSSRRMLVQKLTELNKDFVDVGMGLGRSDNESVYGQVRTTVSLPGMRDHFGCHVDFSDARDDVYATNIQICDLNCLNATFAVIRWKKIRGFYADFVHELNSVYMVEGNVLSNDKE